MSTLSASCTCIYSIRLCHIAFEPQALWLSLFACTTRGRRNPRGGGKGPAELPCAAGGCGDQDGQQEGLPQPQTLPL